MNKTTIIGIQIICGFLMCTILYLGALVIMDASITLSVLVLILCGIDAARTAYLLVKFEEMFKK